MHVHPAAIGLQPIGIYAADNERAAAAQQAAEVRKRLKKASQSANAGASQEETLLIGRWLDQPQSEVLPVDGYRPAAEGEDSDFA